MWHFISDQISQEIGEVFICENAKKIHQQHNHTAYVVRSSQKRFFVKVCTRESRVEDVITPLQAEADGLMALEKVGAISTPKVVCFGQCQENQKHYEYLVLKFIAFKSPSELLWSQAGQQLAELHKRSRDIQLPINAAHYGWHNDNYIGPTRQKNHTSTNWVDFFVQNRLVDLADQLPQKAQLMGPDVWQKITTILQGHDPEPCLLHGDLWIGNIGFCRQQPVIFDPAVWVGDREFDLAMAELFGGFAKVFFSAYEATWPLPEGYAKRRLVYQLAPILNHVLMFDGDYIPQLNLLLDQIMQA
ncbi:fructosamine kinase family protein [Alteromonas sp. ASW11-36]|uniref:Fructosamine kinase family protein n=2 Tax=Alteromonas arenosi TaxID=3055817 RepID=A0ABT7SY43_9ALTE|nr:fructosamine kinase family protein [Alteromonas sp. ASW11-36]